MLHTKFQGHQPFGSGEEGFLRFLPYMCMVKILRVAYHLPVIFIQLKPIQARKESGLQWDSNPGPCDPKLEALTAQHSNGDASNLWQN